MLSLSRNARAVVALVLVAGIAACNRNDPSSFVVSAKSYMAKSDYKAAVIQLKNAIEKAPNDGEARFLLAKTLLDTGDSVGSETEVRKAIDLKYSPDETYPLLARALVAQGKYSEAESFYHRAMAIREKALGQENPKTIATVESYAALLRKMRRDEEATALEARIKALQARLRSNSEMSLSR